MGWLGMRGEELALRGSGRCGMLCGGGGGYRRGIWDLWMGGWLAIRQKRQKEEHTLRIELENVKIALCVRDDHIELFAIREEIGSHDFDMLRRFPKEAELVGLFLSFPHRVSRNLTSGSLNPYHITRKPNPLHCIPHQAQPRPLQLPHHPHKTLHIHKSHGQQRAILLQAPHHTLLALRDEQEPLRAYTRKGGDGAFYLFFGEQL